MGYDSKDRNLVIGNNSGKARVYTRGVWDMRETCGLICPSRIYDTRGTTEASSSCVTLQKCLMDVKIELTILK